MSWKHLGDTTIKSARKPHRCFLCGELIPAKSAYVNRRGAGDGELIEQKMHVECERESHNWDQTDWECFSEGDMERPNPNPATAAGE